MMQMPPLLVLCIAGASIALLVVLALDDRALALLSNALLPRLSHKLRTWRTQGLSLLRGEARQLRLRVQLDEGDDLALELQLARLQLRLLRWVASGFADKPVHLELHGLRLVASMRDLVSDKDEPPEKAQSFRSKMLWMSRLCSFQIRDMDVCIDLLDLQSKVRLTTEEMLVRGHQCVQALDRCGFDIKSTPMEIRVWDGLADDDELGMTMRMQAFLLKFDLGLHSKEMFFTIPECEAMEVHTNVQKMLHVYERLTELDDVAFETLNRTEFPSKVLALHFNLADLQLTLQANDIEAELAVHFPQCVLENIIKAGGKEKKMSTALNCAALQLALQEGAGKSTQDHFLAMERFQIGREQTVFFEQGSIAEEHIQVAGAALDGHVDHEHLEWLLFASIMSKLLPNSRHAPPKQSVIEVDFEKVSSVFAAFQNESDHLVGSIAADKLSVTQRESPSITGSSLVIKADKFAWKADASTSAILAQFTEVSESNFGAHGFEYSSIEAYAMESKLLVGDTTDFQSMVAAEIVVKTHDTNAEPFMRAEGCRYNKSRVPQVPDKVAMQVIRMATCSQSVLQLLHMIKLTDTFGDRATAERGRMLTRFGLAAPSPEISTSKDASAEQAGTLYTLDTANIRYVADKDALLDWSLEQCSLLQSKRSTNVNFQQSHVTINQTPQPLLEMAAVDACVDYEDNLEVWKLRFGSFLLHPCTSMGLGVVTKAMLAQKAALTLALASQSTELNNAARVPSVMRLDFGEFAMMFAAYLGQQHVSDLTTMRLRDLVWNVDSRASDDVMVQDIRTLDDTSEVISYQSIQGGLVDARAASVFVEAHGAEQPLMHLEGFTVNGRLYMAQACDPRIALQSSLTTLYVESLGQSMESGQLQILVAESPAPMKLYGAADFGSARSNFTYNQAAQEATTYASYCSALIVPSDDTIPLSTWDQFRFWIHGNFNFELRCVDMRCTLEDEYLEQALSQFCFDSLGLSFSREHFQMDAQNASACTPAGSNLEADDVSSPAPNLTMHQWMMIPSLTLACNHAWSSESCHHVYLFPPSEQDIFERFRAVGVRWDIRFTTGEFEGEEALVALRLDLISQLLAIISHPATLDLNLHESVPKAEPPATTLQSITTAVAFAAELHRLKLFIWCDRNDHAAMLGGSEVIQINVGATTSPATVGNLLLPTGSQTELALDNTSITLSKLVVAFDNISEHYHATVLEADEWYHMLPTLWRHWVKGKRSTSTMAKASEVAITYAFSEGSHARMPSDISESLLVDLDALDDFHPTLTNFTLNHQTFKPPAQYLPVSERGNQPQLSPPRRRAIVCSGSSPKGAQSKPKSNAKQWNVLVEGFKMLWTINLRDQLYHILGAATDAAKPMSREQPTSPSSLDGATVHAVPTRKESTAGTLMDLIARQDSDSSSVGQSHKPELQRAAPFRRRPSVVEMDMGKRVRSRASSDVSRTSSIRMNSASTMDDDVPVQPEQMQQLLVFKVRLVRPQINCLCEKSHCSLLIVAEDWLVEGYQNSIGLIYLNEPDPQIKHELTMQMDKIVAYTAPSDMYGLDIAVWKDKDTVAVAKENLDVSFEPAAPERLARDQSSVPGASSFLHEVMPEFSLTSSYTYFSAEEMQGALKASRELAENEEMVCQLFLDVPDFELHLNSAQFFVFLNVLRNVLLAPPPVTEAALQKRQEETMQLDGDRKSFGDLDLASKNTRGDVREVLEHSLETQPRHMLVATEMQYFVAKGSWILHGASETERIEITFNGLHGRHLFSVDGSSDTIFELQRAWIRNLRPGADEATLFEDAGSILTPVVHEPTGCARCGKEFIPDENAADACRFHAFADGRHGEFTCDTDGTQQYAWTCCGQRWEGAPGCSSRPHVFSEHMLTVRAEAYPTATLRNIELSVFHHLEISIFPGVAYTLELQVSRTLAEMINRYFLLSATAAPAGHTHSDSNSSDVLLGGSGSGSGSGGSGSGSKAGGFFSFQRRSGDVPPPPDSPILHPPTPSSTRSEVGDLETQREGVYMRHMRLGDINVDVSTAGFAINLDNYIASVPAFVRQRKLSTWQRFISKIEYHATWNLTKSTATSGLAKIKQRFGLHGMRKTARKSSDDSPVDDSKASLLLGGNRRL